jgi:methyltransferase (TIGR00027 family)
MQAGQASRTALGAAAHRAAHQVLERGFIFSDPLALRILGAEAERIVIEAKNDPSKLRLRLFIAIRSRFAEDALAVAISGGTRQLVVLGAGLDTFAYRSNVTDLRIFEIDHPATQAWKRQRLADASIEIPPSLIFAPVDFERETLDQGLAKAGFDPLQPSFFTWLGVVPYLTEQAVLATLSYIAHLAGGAQVVFDYGNPVRPEDHNSERALALEALSNRVEALGESFRTFFESERLHEQLREIGFTKIEDLGPKEIAMRYFPGRAINSNERGAHVVLASTSQ